MLSAGRPRGRQGTASPSAHSLVGPALQSISLPWARPTLCLCLSVTGPFVSCATYPPRLCPDTLFHPQPQLHGALPSACPCQGSQRC